MILEVPVQGSMMNLSFVSDEGTAWCQQCVQEHVCVCVSKQEPYEKVSVAEYFLNGWASGIPIVVTPKQMSPT